MPQDKYSISGYEIVSRTVKPHGNGARVGVPKDWIGEEATIIRRTKEDESGTISPIAALMYDSIVEDGASLEDAMEKVVRFQSFRDINTEVAVDFRDCLGSSTERVQVGLNNRSEERDNLIYSNFYRDLAEGAASRNALKDALESWM